jgi:hypothetical protein
MLLVACRPCDGCPSLQGEYPQQWCEETRQAFDCASVLAVRRIASIALQIAKTVRQMDLTPGERWNVANAVGMGLDDLMRQELGTLNEWGFRLACGVPLEVPNE